MPMELRKRKAPAAPVVPPPAPKRKATAPKKEKKPAEAAAAPSKDAEPKPTSKKVALPKKGKTAEKAEVTTEPPATAADPEVLPEAPAAESSKPKAAAKPKAAKETKTAKAAEPAKKEEKPKEKAAPAAKEKKETATKAKKDKAPAEAAAAPSKPAEEKKSEKKAESSSKKEDKKEKKAAPAKAGSSKSATATPAPAAPAELKAGDALPTGLPEISNHAGEKVTIGGLLDASKKGVVIFAYPAASTPGCTKQANFFNASKDSFESEGYSIYGLSGDKPEKNSKFKDAQKLTYPLLSDVSYELHSKLGIAKAGGKGTLRSVVVIGKDGKIVSIKKAGPEETLKIARAACGLAADDAKVKAVEKVDAKKEEKAEIALKQPTVEEAPDANA
ncbi:hypothetical protein ABW19_dt0203629 [Dactylella cylindrospora]|nr:hypothetical protein ABW19_dt0203629 [Dactylella cylindrospora]